MFYWAEVSACIVHDGFPVTALSGVTPCVPLHCHYVPTHSHTDAHTHTSLLTPAGPLESWRRQALAGMYPDIPPSWRPVSDAPAARRAEAQLQSDACHNCSPAPLSCVIDFFSMESVFHSWPKTEDLDSSQPECYQILVYCVLIVFMSILCVGMDESKENSVFFFKPQLCLKSCDWRCVHSEGRLSWPD